MIIRRWGRLCNLACGHVNRLTINRLIRAFIASIRRRCLRQHCVVADDLILGRLRNRGNCKKQQ